MLPFNSYETEKYICVGKNRGFKKISNINPIFVSNVLKRFPDAETAFK